MASGKPVGMPPHSLYLYILLDKNTSLPYAVIAQNFMCGVGCGWIAPMISRFKDSNEEFSLTDEDCSWIASLHFLGRGVGSLVAAATVDWLGRSSLFVLIAVLTLLVWISVALTTRVLLHCAIRFVFGLAVGLFDTTSPIYLGENCSPHMRGIFGTASCLCFFAGELLVFGIGTYLSYAAVAYILVALAIAALGSTLLLREPAQHLIAKGRQSQARHRFAWLRGTDARAQAEFDDLQTKLADLRVCFSARMFLNRGVRIVTTLNLLSFLNGFPAINQLLTFILAPTPTFSVNQLTIFYGLAQLLGVLLSTLVVERFGRRTLWMTSALLCAIAHSTAAGLHFLRLQQGGLQPPYFAWAIFAAITAFATVFAALLLPLCTTARAELLPAQFKAAGVCASILLSSVTAFFVCRIFLFMVNAFGEMSNYIFYALVSLLMLVYVYFWLPETKGFTLMEIQKLLDE